MSQSIFWDRIGVGTSLPVNAPSSFIDCLEGAFSSLPITLGREDLPVLRGMKAALTHERRAIEELEEAIEKHGEVKVWAA